MLKICLVVSLLVSALLPGRAADFYVAPDGKPQGDGRKENPLDLNTALSDKTPAKPGDTLWLRGGVYKGMFTSTLTGKEGQPITVRQFPGERATIDGSLTVQGGWAVYWGFEVMNSNPDRVSKGRPTGVNILGHHTKFINLIVHDTGVGMGFWAPAEESEIYGCIIYHNGWQGPDPDRGHGHAIYTQNNKGTKLIVDNVMFNQFGWGIHAYTERGAIKGFHFEGNVAFNNGSATRQGHRYDNILVGGYTPAERITLIRNYTYHTPSKGGSNVRLHYTAKNNKDLTCMDNYFVGGSVVASVREWEKVVMTGNTFYGLHGLVSLAMPQGVETSAYEWDNNTYITRESDTPFNLQGQALDFARWQQTTGFDKNSKATKAQRPGGVKVFIRPNRYEPGRAHIIVYNWDIKEAVDVDISGVLPIGAKYEVRNVLDYFGKPVAMGTYDGKPLLLPMTGTETGAEFNVFVVVPHREHLRARYLGGSHPQPDKCAARLAVPSPSHPPLTNTPSTLLCQLAQFLIRVHSYWMPD